MLLALTSWKEAIQHITKDRVNFVMALVPVLIGLLLYYFLGSWLYGTAMEAGQNYIKQSLGDGSLGSATYYIALVLMTVLFYFVINYTFVLVVTLIASPLNDLISLRVEKRLLGKDPLPMGEAIKGTLARIGKTILNEIKKLLFVLVLSSLAFLLSSFPLLAPLSLLIGAILVAVEFLDYSWSRHELSFNECFKDIRSGILTYGLAGGIVMVIITVPLINLTIPALATSYFTTIWVKKNESRNKITE